MDLAKQCKIVEEATGLKGWHLEMVGVWVWRATLTLPSGTVSGEGHSPCTAALRALGAWARSQPGAISVAAASAISDRLGRRATTTGRLCAPRTPIHNLLPGDRP